MKSQTVYIIIGLVVLYLLIYFVFIKKSKYYLFFQKELGFGDEFLNKFSSDELKASYIYINDYSREGKKLTANNNPELYKQIKAINDKFHIFTNII